MDEGNEEYIPCDSPIDAKSFLRSHLVDPEDDEDVRLHMAALSNDITQLKQLLSEESAKEWLNYPVRPFHSTPLRLAVTVGNLECVCLLLNEGANIDQEDVKGQTPLFVSTSNKNLKIMEELLRRGANPEGSPLNRGTPLIVAVRDGFAKGVKLLLKYGANSEPFSIMATCVPGWPLQHAVVYCHFSCFLALIQGGAIPNLDGPFCVLSPNIVRRLSIPHAILKYCSDKPEFVRLYHDCGGNLNAFNMQDLLCDNPSPAAKAISELQKTPRNLKSLSRGVIRNCLGHKSCKISKLEIPMCLKSFLRFEEYELYASLTKENCHTKIL